MGSLYTNELLRIGSLYLCDLQTREIEEKKKLIGVSDRTETKYCESGFVREDVKSLYM